MNNAYKSTRRIHARTHDYLKWQCCKVGLCIVLCVRSLKKKTVCRKCVDHSKSASKNDLETAKISKKNNHPSCMRSSRSIRIVIFRAIKSNAPQLKVWDFLYTFSKGNSYPNEGTYIQVVKFSCENCTMHPKCATLICI